ncbi:MAG: ADP-ribosylglycohydrolase family protein [Tannerellaceae bacterium]|jgi:ADP-ribosylglycohydrolase|nr:ADP-ribosylglycohydrolase family protein [Tannerellaceae bacterium]
MEFYRTDKGEWMREEGDWIYSPIDYIRAVLLGVSVGDALGVPVEFKSREELKLHPVSDMMGYGTYYQAAGTWSDDSSLTFCLAEALTEGFSVEKIGENFVKWRYQNYWTARGEVFDVGIATDSAIARIAKGIRADLAGGRNASDNGNGSLMRIAPLLFYIGNRPIEERFSLTSKVSSVTHGHIRSLIACFYYLEFARQIVEGREKFKIYKKLQTDIPAYLSSIAVEQREIALFDRLLKDHIYELPEEDIQSSGYVLHTLEASIWCLLSTTNYKDAVLKAVNLGGDTDTTAAVSGGLAGLLYGVDEIPLNWREQIARKDDIEDLAKRLAEKY